MSLQRNKNKPCPLTRFRRLPQGGDANAFKGSFGPFTFEQMNIWGCVPNSEIDALDIAVDVDAVKGFAFPCSVVWP